MKAEDFHYEFDGNGIVITGQMNTGRNDISDYVARVEVYLDDILTDTLFLPANFKLRKFDIYWNYKLPEKKHNIRLKMLNPIEEKSLIISSIVVYSGSSENMPGLKD